MKFISLFLVSFIFIYTFAFGQDYYRSNSIGMVFEKIPSFRIDDFPWVIKLSKDGALETRVIYLNGEEKKRLEYFREDDLLVVSEYVLNDLVRIEKLMDGLVVKEEYYKDEATLSTFIYEWSGRQLQKITYIENDLHIYDDLFIVEEHGPLKQIRRFFNQGEFSTSGFGYSNQGIKTEWHGTDDESSLYRYEDGKIVRIENWQDGALIRAKTFTPTESGSTVLESDFLTGIEIRKLYDLDDKLLSDETRDGSNIVKYTYLYEGELLVEKKMASPGIRKKHLFYYNNDDSLQSEKIFMDDILIKEIFYDFGKKELEKVYRDNTLILMVFYKNGEEIREERIK